jgi:16S rRNA (cytosine967-C5)-methyltransferase
MAFKNARAIVYDALFRLEKDHSYSNLILDASLKKSALSGQDKGFASRLFYGVIERKLTLDHIVSCYSKQPLERLHLGVRIILWMGLYQLLYLDTPDSAAVNESVKLTSSVKPGAKGFVNAVLRQFIRDGKSVSYPEDSLKRLSIQYSCPEWLVAQYRRDYGAERMKEILENSLLPPPITLRVNSLKISGQELAVRLKQEGIETLPVSGMSHCLAVVKGNPVESRAFAEGLFHVQDIASQLCAFVAASRRPKRLFDLCAAPGGKSFTIAEEIFPQGGTVFSFDLHPKRVRLIENGAKRLGLTEAVSASVADASVYFAELGQADCVLCDVPCSGLGVIRRKPEIKYKPMAEIKNLPLIQLNILENASNYVVPGGFLVYSTCSLSKLENEQVVETFLKKNPSFAPEQLPELPFLEERGFQATFFPVPDGPDGFYLALMKRAE